MQVFYTLQSKTTLIDWIGNSVTVLYAKYLANMLCMVRLWNKKCSETGPRRRCSGPEQYQYLFQYYLWFYDYCSIHSIIPDLISMIYKQITSKLSAGQRFSWLWTSEPAHVLVMNIN